MLTSFNYATPTVPEGWAEKRDTHPAVAMAIHAIAGSGRSAAAVWVEPCESELEHIEAAVQQYLDAGLFERNANDRYQWFDEVLVVLIEEEAA